MVTQNASSATAKNQAYVSPATADRMLQHGLAVILQPKDRYGFCLIEYTYKGLRWDYRKSPMSV